jgi:hypothetical protein
MTEEISFPKVVSMGTREWQFSGIDKGKLILSRPEGLILKVKLEDTKSKNQIKPKIKD